MRSLFFMLLLLYMGDVCFAQSNENEKNSIALLARGYSNSVILRYFPTTPGLLEMANKAGYVVEKAIYKEGISFEKLTYTTIKGSPFKRWSGAEWEQAAKGADQKDTNTIKLAGFAMLLSDPNAKTAKEDVLANDLKSLKEERDNQDMKLAFTILSSSRSKMAAEGLAMRITDNEIVPTATYVYRVRINDSSENTKSGNAYVRVKCGSFNEKYLMNPKAVKVVEEDESISFTFPESKEYYAFNIERLDDGSASYQKLTSEPSFKIKPKGFNGKTDHGFVDSNLTNYKKYTYRVLVSTPFADDLLLAEFIAIPRDKTPPNTPFIKSAEHVKPRQVKLTWEMMGKKTGDLKGFNIRRSPKKDGTFTLISKVLLPAVATSYIDETFNQDSFNYYIVESVDTAGNGNSSFPAYVTLIDSVPPVEPVISSARIDTAGKIIIKVKPNMEKDFMGYQVLKANSKEHEFSVVTETYKDSLGRTTFTLNDSTTLNTLTKKIYYKVIAFDTHFNQSVPSKIIELTKRDTIPPVSPLITGFTVSDTSVVIIFVNSTSEDAVRNILLRRESGKGKFDSIFFNTNTRVTKFIDKKITGGLQYEYAMIARDDGGLASRISKSIQIKTLLNNRIPAPTIQGSYDGQTKKVSLSFVVDEKVKNRQLKVEIYKRADEKSLWTTYKIIEFEKGKPFFDEPVEGQKGMIYTIRLTDANKNVSNFSNELQLKY